MTDNPKLDATHLCAQGAVADMFDMIVTGNFNDCGICARSHFSRDQDINSECNGGLITAEILHTYRKCKTLIGGLLLINFTFTEDLSALTNVVQIRGDVEIGFTDFENLTFLKNVKVIVSRNGRLGDKVVVNIHDNYEMTRLGFNERLVSESWSIPGFWAANWTTMMFYS